MVDSREKYVESLKKGMSDLSMSLQHMKKQYDCLEKENEDIKKSYLKFQSDSENEIRELKAEIERLRQKCREVPCEGCDCESEEIDLESLVYKLQDQHQQDCIRYNDMRTAFLKTVDELAMLRKQFGVGQ